MGGSASSAPKEPLLQPTDEHVVLYESEGDSTPAAELYQHLPLLKPDGNLSLELTDALDEIFEELSESKSLIMTVSGLTRYVEKCYPVMSQSSRDELAQRCDYLLEHNGKPYKMVKDSMQSALQSAERSGSEKVTLVETGLAPPTPSAGDGTETESIGSSSSRANAARMRSYSLMRCEESTATVRHSCSLEIADDDRVLTKLAFFVFYRKRAIDKPMVTRLELSCLGVDKFKSSVYVDRTKSVDILAFKVHQTKNLMSVFTEEKQRFAEAETFESATDRILKYIEKTDEPLDTSDSNNNIFRRRKPMSCPLCCCCCD